VLDQNIHPVVIANDDGTLDRIWSSALPYEWWPHTLEDLQIVVCLGPEVEADIETCLYTKGTQITRYQMERSIRLLEAHSGREIASGVVNGIPARRCEEVESQGMQKFRGQAVTVEDVQTWIQPYITGLQP